MPHLEKQLTSTEIFNGCVIRVTRDEVKLENGNTSFREVVHHGGGAGIVALDGEGRIALVRQYRYALGQELWEIPAGKIEKGEPPIETARRELAEETACKADSLVPFGSVIPTCGYCTEIIYIFLATGITILEEGQSLDADEFVDVVWKPLEEAVSMVLNGEITDSKSVSGILRLHAKLLGE